MSKISQYTDGGALQATDQFLIARAGASYKLLGSALGGSDWTTIVKQADESVVNSTSRQADDELFFATVNAVWYEFEICLIYASPGGAGTPDLQVAVGCDTTSSGNWMRVGLNTGDSGTVVNLAADTAHPATAGTAAADRPLYGRGWFPGNGNNFMVYWAQNTLDATNATIVRAGSYLRYREFPS